MFIKNLGKSFGYTNCIPNNGEIYKSFTKGLCVGCKTKRDEGGKKGKGGKKDKKKFIFNQMRFLDSFKFMPSSISRLVSYLKEEDFKIVKDYYPEDKLDLLMRKGVHPYDYMDSPRN